MAARSARRLDTVDPGRPLAAGLLALVVLVAACTAAVYGLRELAPALSLGVVYLIAVLVVAANWGRAMGAATGVASALAFNVFHIPPTGRLTIAESEHAVALLAFLVAAFLVSSIAATARTRARDLDERRREADLSAELARTLLSGDRLPDAVAAAARRLAQALELPSAAIELRAVEGDARSLAFPLRDGPAALGTLVVPRDTPEPVLRRLQERVVPALEALLRAARERVDLQAEVVETAALRRGDTVKTALLRTVSHDLRSPLTAIATAGEGLAAPAIGDADRRELAAVVGEEAARLTRLIDNLLDLSRLEAGAAEPRREWIALEDVLRSAAQDASGGRPEAVGESFRFAVAPDLPLVRADAAQLERALANVLENARRHSGGHPVSVRARAVGDRLVVRIVDRGPGIPSAQLGRVFEPFFQAGTERSGGARRSGLGLAIARGFVEANGGRLSAESLPGQGASFVVELPFERPPASAPPALAAPPGPARS